MAVSSLSYGAVRLAQRLSTDSLVAGRRSDVSLAASPRVTWYLSYYFFPSALLQQHFTDSAGAQVPSLHSLH